MKCFFVINNYTTQTNQTNQTKRKMFCKVCKDAGKSEKMCKSHYVRDAPGPNGKVVCPTLLNQICRKCKNKGHIASYCVMPPPFKKKNITPTSAAAPASAAPPPPPPPPFQVQHKQPQLVNWAGIVSRVNNASSNNASSNEVTTEEVTTEEVTTEEVTTEEEEKETFMISANINKKNERPDSPTPSPISSRPTSRPTSPSFTQLLSIVPEEEPETKYIHPSCQFFNPTKYIPTPIISWFDVTDD